MHAGSVPNVNLSQLHGLLFQSAFADRINSQLYVKLSGANLMATSKSATESSVESSDIARTVSTYAPVYRPCNGLLTHCGYMWMS